MLLAHSIALSTGGIPLLYLGDEVGQLNDYGFLAEADRADDSRWVHRPTYPTRRYAERFDPDTDAGSIYLGLKRLLTVRRQTSELAGDALVGFRTHDPHVLGYQRPGPDGTVLVLANLAEEPAVIGAAAFAAMPGTAHDLVTDVDVELWADLELAPLQFLWLQV